MIGYVTVGTNDMARAARFYDELLTVLGAKRMIDTDSFKGWTTDRKAAALAIAKPFDGKPATVGNGVMVAIAASSREQVDEIHAKALALGGTDEGKPGDRGGNFYAGYFRDLDGNKLNVYFVGEA